MVKPVVGTLVIVAGGWAFAPTGGMTRVLADGDRLFVYNPNRTKIEWTGTVNLARFRDDVRWVLWFEERRPADYWPKLGGP